LRLSERNILVCTEVGNDQTRPDGMRVARL
jgi:hypothetical protein